MYKGTMIDDLIHCVERAEEHARDERPMAIEPRPEVYRMTLQAPNFYSAAMHIQPVVGVA